MAFSCPDLYGKASCVLPADMINHTSYMLLWLNVEKKGIKNNQIKEKMLVNEETPGSVVQVKSLDFSGEGIEEND